MSCLLANVVFGRLGIVEAMLSVRLLPSWSAASSGAATNTTGRRAMGKSVGGHNGSTPQIIMRKSIHTHACRSLFEMGGGDTSAKSHGTHGRQSANGARFLEVWRGISTVE